MATVAATPADYVGKPLRRREDGRLLTGAARFVDDIAAPGALHAFLVRSPYAHARIRSVDVAPALAAPGVAAAFSGADLLGDWVTPLPMVWPVSDDCVNPPHWPLAPDVARHLGDAVAVVLARTRAQARDAAELVEVDYEPLPAVAGVEEALRDGAPAVHAEAPGNRCYTWRLDCGDVERVFAEADVVLAQRYRQNRLVPSAMEPRGVLVETSAITGDYTLVSSTQSPHLLRPELAAMLGIDEGRLRVIAPDVGGGFGSKVEIYAEEALCLALARRLGAPVRWTEERSEGFLATIHARDQVQEIELAGTRNGRIRGVRVRLLANMGAYLYYFTPGIPILGADLYSGSYDVEAYSFACTGVFTHTTPTDAYRGAGRPEATYAIERAIDALARELELDPAEIRRRNFIREFPKRSVTGRTIDAGDYHATLARGLELAGYDALRAEQAERRARGDARQLGIGLSTYVEMCGLAPSRLLGLANYDAGGWEAATVRVLPTGAVELYCGSTPHGQGHATTFTQILADRLGVPVETIRFVAGDTALVPLGGDTYGSRSLVIAGPAIWHAAGKVLDKARAIAAHALEAAGDDLEYAGARFSVKGSPERGVTLAEVGYAAWTAHDLPEGMEPGLEALHVYDPVNFSWPAGAHVAAVEVDTETGAVSLRRFVAVDDVGRVVNPLVVEGQVHGGLAQGIAQALWESAEYDEDANLLSGSFLSYLVPSAAELISFETDRTETPSPSNPIGAKGAGETGTIGSPPAVVNAVLDALRPLGVTHLDMPLAPERVWSAIAAARV